MWNYANQIAPVTNHVKTVWSNEHFSCHDVAIAIPWNASQTRNSISLACSITSSRQEVLDEFHNEHDSSSCSHTEDSPDGDSLYQLPSGNFTLSSAFFAESAPRGSATWPEEQLPSNSTTQSTLRKSQYKFLKASCQNAATHAWGQVIVAAGWDGYIRSFQNYGLPVQVWHGTRHASFTIDSPWQRLGYALRSLAGWTWRPSWFIISAQSVTWLVRELNCLWTRSCM